MGRGGRTLRLSRAPAREGLRHVNGAASGTAAQDVDVLPIYRLSLFEAVQPSLSPRLLESFQCRFYVIVTS